MALSLIQAIIPTVFWLIVVTPLMIFVYFGVKKQSTPPLFNLMLYVAIASPIIMFGSMIAEGWLLDLLLKNIEVERLNAEFLNDRADYSQSVQNYIISDGGRKTAVLIITFLLPIYVLLLTVISKFIAHVSVRLRGFYSEHAV